MGGGCYGGWCCTTPSPITPSSHGDGVGVVVLWGDGMVLWTTLQNQLTFSDLTFGDYFLLCPLSPISSFSYLSSMYMYMYTSPSSPLAPSDVSSPLVVMATSSSITVTGGPQLACWGSPDHDLQCAGTTDDTSDCCDRFATSNHIFGLHIYTCSSVYCWWSRGGATSHH